MKAYKIYVLWKILYRTRQNDVCITTATSYSMCQHSLLWVRKRPTVGDSQEPIPISRQHSKKIQSQEKRCDILLFTALRNSPSRAQDL